MDIIRLLPSYAANSQRPFADVDPAVFGHFAAELLPLCNVDGLRRRQYGRIIVSFKTRSIKAGLWRRGWCNAPAFDPY